MLLPHRGSFVTMKTIFETKNVQNDVLRLYMLKFVDFNSIFLRVYYVWCVVCVCVCV